MGNFELDERTLPLSIQKDIKALKECQKPENKNKDIDIYWSELYGSINGSQHGGEISKEIVDYLREKYLGI